MLHRLIACSLIVLAAGQLALANLSIKKCIQEEQRLSTKFKPVHYDLTIKPNLETQTFVGELNLTLQLDGLNLFKFLSLRNDQLLIHFGPKLKLMELQGFNSKQSPIKISSLCYDGDKQMLSMDLNRIHELSENFTLKIVYSGIINGNDKPEGFYLDAEDRAVTDFWPANARTVFPCFDEPKFKATFQLTIEHSGDLIAASNTEKVTETILQNGEVQAKRTKFAKTPLMSPHLVAFIVGKYEKVHCDVERGKKELTVNAYVPLGRGKEARFVLDTFCKAIPFAENYFELAFPLGKLDLFSATNAREYGRENWGLIMMKEVLFLNDPERISNQVLDAAAKFACHLVLHQWIGALVTARWWDDQWIMDGFTIWHSHVLANKVYRSHQYEFDYLYHLQTSELTRHSSADARAIKLPSSETEVKTAEELLKLFDEPTYNKAGALYKMLEDYIEPEVFRKSLVKMLENHKYSTVDQRNFVDAINEVSKKNVFEMVDGWLRNPGVPLVEVGLSDNHLLLRQRRLLAETNKRGKKADPIWQVPISIRIVKSHMIAEEKTLVLGREVETIELPTFFKNCRGCWLKLNWNFSSFYRTLYFGDLLRHMRPLIKSVSYWENKLNVLEDVRALYQLGLMRLEQVVLVFAMYREQSLNSLRGSMIATLDALEADNEEELAEFFTGWLYREKFDWKKAAARTVPEHGLMLNYIDHAEQNGRSEWLLYLIRQNNEEAINEALETFDETVDQRSEATDADSKLLVPAYRKPVFAAALVKGNEEQFERSIQRLGGLSSKLELKSTVAIIAPLVKDKDRLEKLKALIN